ncbi:MAG: hypothetical protein JO362_21685, partial [Streptomycetaceae bacterium]|nr:hypothetical protein [Streptomycetaceae bacterium]
LREAADWSKGIVDFRAGWAGYGRLGEVGKGVVAAGLHEMGLVGAHAGDAGLHEPQVAPVVAGMRWDRMLTGLEKLPQAEFQQLLVRASGLVQPVMGMAPVLVREAGAQGLRGEEFASLVAVAYVLHTQGEEAAQALAGALAKELGAAPLPGLAGGAPMVKPVPGESSGRPVFLGESSGTTLWVPQTSRVGGLPGLEERGLQVGAGEHAPLVPVVPSPSELRQQHLDQIVVETGAIPTHSGLLVPVTSVFAPPALQTLERIGKEGLPPEAEKQLFHQVLSQVSGMDHVTAPVTVPVHVADPHQTLELLKPGAATTPEAVHSAPPRTLPSAFARQGVVGEALPLHGVAGLEGARIRWAPVEGVPHLEVVDAHGQVLAGRVVELQPGGGFTISGGPQGMVHFSRGTVREVPLSAPGLEGLHLQMMEGSLTGGRFESTPFQLVDATGEVVPGREVLLGANETVTITAGEGALQWSFDSTLRLESLQVRMPTEDSLIGQRIDALAGRTVRMEYRADGTVSRSVEGGSVSLKSLFREVAVPRELVDRLGAGGFSLEDKSTHLVVQLNVDGHPVMTDERVEGGILRYDLTMHQTKPVRLEPAGGLAHAGAPVTEVAHTPQLEVQPFWISHVEFVDGGVASEEMAHEALSRFLTSESFDCEQVDGDAFLTADVVEPRVERTGMNNGFTPTSVPDWTITEHGFDWQERVSQDHSPQGQDWFDQQELTQQDPTQQDLTNWIDELHDEAIPIIQDIPQPLVQQAPLFPDPLFARPKFELAAHQADRFREIRWNMKDGPGGLLEPDAVEQRALEEALPLDTDGTFKKFPNPFDRWFSLVNDGGFEAPGRATNCSETTRAALETWYGNPQVSGRVIPNYDARDSLSYFFAERNSVGNTEYWMGAPLRPAGPPDTAYREIAERLVQTGQGSSAVITVLWAKGGNGHALLALNYEGTVVWGDAQIRIVSLEPLYPHAAEVWYGILDANRMPA